MFRPLHPDADAPNRGEFRADARFAGLALAAPPTRPDDALAQAWDDGFRAGAAEMRVAREADSVAGEQVALALSRLTDREAEHLAEKLRETVIALCQTVVETGAIDPDALSRRIISALALLRRATDDRVLRLHPDDLALLADRLPAGLETRADPALERGALRLETAAGGVEDGPAQWREAIAAAVRAC